MLANGSNLQGGAWPVAAGESRGQGWAAAQRHGRAVGATCERRQRRRGGGTCLAPCKDLCTQYDMREPPCACAQCSSRSGASQRNKHGESGRSRATEGCWLPGQALPVLSGRRQAREQRNRLLPGESCSRCTPAARQQAPAAAPKVLAMRWGADGEQQPMAPNPSGYSHEAAATPRRQRCRVAHASLHMFSPARHGACRCCCCWQLNCCWGPCGSAGPEQPQRLCCQPCCRFALCVRRCPCFIVRVPATGATSACLQLNGGGTENGYRTRENEEPMWACM